jgi:CBS-domain-containing membrane protein
MQRLIAVIAGAAGGAVAIALMELLSERAAFPLVLVPFATSIVLVMGSPEIEAAQPARSSAGTWCPRWSGCWW